MAIVERKRIAVVGAGANGAAIGADLTRAGHDVTLVEQWPDHVAAMQARGVRVNLPRESITTKVRAVNFCDVATLRQAFDVVFMLVKAYDTRWAAELIKPLLAPDALVVGVQNGMSIDSIADVVGIDRALGAVIEITSNMFEPGVVNRQSAHERSWFAVGGLGPAAQARAGEVAELLSCAGRVEVSEDIRASKWMKLVVNAAELVPSAVLGLPLGDAVTIPGFRDFMLQAGREAIRTAVATGVRIRPIFGLQNLNLSDPDGVADALFDEVIGHFTESDTKTTVLQDWLKGRRSEVDQINGLVVTEQRRLGGAAPANEITVKLAHLIENGELRATPENAETMIQAIGALAG
ncbi:ketopantoate reductase family protein [Arthrobacter sp. KNU-44]|uniref:ketopantoate reductase family protein n=1 Tax=Arthrobacter sp. KNU-44 TaxID=3450744 RepID=UPI003F42C0FC